MKERGIFTLSLDFELFWGIRDKKTIDEYGENVLGARMVVPQLLEMFKKYKIHATWAVVGAMICDDVNELLEFTPVQKPTYKDKNLSPYGDFFDDLKNVNPKYIFGKDLLNIVKETPHQEIGSHTFSHYYCLEEGQLVEEFIDDTKASISILDKNGIIPNSIIFPRHQVNEDYLQQILPLGIHIYRGVEKIWYNSPAKTGDEGILKRIFRFSDYYLPMFSHHCQHISDVRQGDLYEIKASRWLRPYSDKWQKLDVLKMRRIKSQMKHAAINGKIFHLWFHPHDIGINIEKNIEYLEEIFKYYQVLNKKYGFASKNFTEIKNISDNL